MKKLLAICSVFFSVCAVFTGCGDNNNGSDVNNDSHVSSDEPHKNVVTSTGKNNAGDYVNGVIDGVEDAGDDIINGAGDAAEDIIDGVSGNNSQTSTSAPKVSKAHRSR